MASKEVGHKGNYAHNMHQDKHMVVTCWIDKQIDFLHSTVIATWEPHVIVMWRIKKERKSDSASPPPPNSLVLLCSKSFN